LSLDRESPTSRNGLDVRGFALVCVLLVACGGARKHVEEPDDDDEESAETTQTPEPLDPIVAGPPPALTATTSDIVAAIERGPCFGSCPVYNLTVYRTGELRYEGTSNVKTIGIVIDRVTPAQLVKVDEHFASHDFETLAGQYTEYAATDHTTVTTWYRVPSGVVDAIVHNHGIRDIISSELREIEDGFDQIVESERWIGTEQERARLRR